MTTSTWRETNWLGEVARRAQRDFPGEQPWAGQYRRRALEMASLRRLLPERPAGAILELGCGNGYGTALLADRGARLVATDLARPNRVTHSIGLARAKRLLTGLGLPH